MRVMIVSPHFPPTSAADMHRVRVLLPFFEKYGVDVEVLAVQPEQVAAPQDDWLETGIPDDVPVHRVKAIGLKWGGIPGLGILAYRAFGALKKRGDELFERGGADRSRGYDLIYFSTTQYGLCVLGARWAKKFKIPFVMDYQDPWVSEYYDLNPESIPPGGYLKYGVVASIAKKQEPYVLKNCSGITSVSSPYIEALESRYEWFRAVPYEDCCKYREGLENGYIESSVSRVVPSLVAPFPGDIYEHERVLNSNVRQNIFDNDDGCRHWVYVGRGGKDMVIAAEAIISAVSRFREACKKLRIHFIGTSYAATGKGVKTLESLGVKYGLSETIREYTDRIPYSEALQCLHDAEALIVPGSDDPNYTASKIYPFLLAKKPLLAVFHENSSVVDIIDKCKGGTIIKFSSKENVGDISGRIFNQVFSDGFSIRYVPLDMSKFYIHTAESQASVMSEYFRCCIVNHDMYKRSSV